MGGAGLSARLEGAAGVESRSDALKRDFVRFLKTTHVGDSEESYSARANGVALAFPQKRTVVVRWWDVQRFSDELADAFLDKPDQTLKIAAEALRELDYPIDGPAPHGLRVAVEDLPERAQVTIRGLRDEHVRRMVSVRGLVKRVYPVTPRIQDAVYRCKRCAALIAQSQETDSALVEPLECYEDQGGCGRRPDFTLLLGPDAGPQSSKLYSQQRAVLEESPEGMRAGQQPRALTLLARDDLCDAMLPGNRVTVTGILQALPKKTRNVKQAVLETFLEVVSVRQEATDFEDVEITDVDLAAIEELRRDPEILPRLKATIAPAIYGLSFEKEALALQLFGGVEKWPDPKTRLRGDTHILLVGDPGVAKSQLLRFMVGLSPRGVFTNAGAATRAGLTAAAVKDEDDVYQLEAGAMVIADRGLLAIDELDKGAKEDISAMHEAMEQGSVSKSAAGISANLRARCAVLAAANPKGSRFDPNTSLPEQLSFQPSLLSRFDLIFTLTDKPDKKRDDAISAHILAVHSRASHDQAHAPTVPVDGTIDLTLLRKYVAHARRTIHPTLTDAAKTRLREYFVNLRWQAFTQEGSGPVPMTLRQLEALIRLSEASARLHLRRDVLLEDAERAIKLVEYSIRKMNGSEGGILDIDVLETGMSHANREAIRKVKEIVRNLCAGVEGAHKDDVVAEGVAKGLDRERITETIRRLKQMGEVFEPKTNLFRVS